MLKITEMARALVFVNIGFDDSMIEEKTETSIGHAKTISRCFYGSMTLEKKRKQKRHKLRDVNDENMVIQ